VVQLPEAEVEVEVEVEAEVEEGAMAETVARAGDQRKMKDGLGTHLLTQLRPTRLRQVKPRV